MSNVECRIWSEDALNRVMSSFSAYLTRAPEENKKNGSRETLGLSDMRKNKQLQFLETVKTSIDLVVNQVTSSSRRSLQDRTSHPNSPPERCTVSLGVDIAQRSHLREKHAGGGGLAEASAGKSKSGTLSLFES